MFNIFFATHSLSTLVHDLQSRVKIFSKALAQVVMDFDSRTTGERLVNVYQKDCESRAGGGVVSMASHREYFAYIR